MRAIPLRTQLWAIGFGYAAVALYAVTVLYARHVAELQNPIESQGGMWAFGDELMYASIFIAFLVPTFLLLWVMRNFEALYTTYAKILLAGSLTAPLSLGVLAITGLQHEGLIYDTLMMRLWRSPAVFVVLVMSRVFARAKLAKRLTTIAMLVEGGTLAVVVALFLFWK